MSESDAHLPESATPSTEATPPPAPKAAEVVVPAKRSGLDLTDLKIMPAWVSDFGKEPAARIREYDEQERPSQRGDARRGGGQGRGGRGFGQDSSSRPRGDRPAFRRPEGGDRNERGGPRPPRGEGGFRGRDRDRRHGDGPPQREWVDIPKDIQVSVHPEDKSLDALSAHIRGTGHAFSLFDVSRLVLAGGERFGVRFLCDEKRVQPMYRVPADGALFLTRDEALQHVLRGPVLESFYRIEEIELEEPKGNFPSVAVCGFSGEILGPASHHSFQTSIIRLHRERFSHMTLEDYKRRIRTETDPELVQKWKDLQRKATRWIPLSSEPEAAPAPPSPAPAEAGGEAEPSPETEEAAPSPTTPAVPENALATRQEVELHFKRHHGDQAVVEVRDITIPGNIDKKKLSPALFILLRQTVEAARKHLFEMSQRLSAGFDRRGLKTFKRRSGKMFVSRVRPKAVDPTTVFAERVTAIVEHLKKAPGGVQLNDLLTALSGPAAPFPQPATGVEQTDTAESAAAPPLTDEQLATLKDLRWLANEGYIIEYSDGLVTLGVQGDTAAQSTAPKKSAAAPAPEPEAVTSAAAAAAAEEPVSESAANEAPAPEPTANVETAPGTATVEDTAAASDAPTQPLS